MHSYVWTYAHNHCDVELEQQAWFWQSLLNLLKRRLKASYKELSSYTYCSSSLRALEIYINLQPLTHTCTHYYYAKPRVIGCFCQALYASVWLAGTSVWPRVAGETERDWEKAERRIRKKSESKIFPELLMLLVLLFFTIHCKKNVKFPENVRKYAVSSCFIEFSYLVSLCFHVFTHRKLTF